MTDDVVDDLISMKLTKLAILQLCNNKSNIENNKFTDKETVLKRLQEAYPSADVYVWFNNQNRYNYNFIRSNSQYIIYLIF